MRQFGFVSWLCVVTAALLLLAVADLPYGYYVALRWWVCAAAALAAFDGLEFRSPRLMLIPLALAILFNPAAPIPLGRDLWMVADVIAAGAFVLLAWLCRNWHAVSPQRQPGQPRSAPDA